MLIQRHCEMLFFKALDAFTKGFYLKGCFEAKIFYNLIEDELLGFFAVRQYLMKMENLTFLDPY